MASIAAAAPERGAASPLAVTFIVMIGTFMTVLDSTIANVALPHMQPSLNAAADTITWVLTSYIVATAIAIPLTGWLAARIGRRTLFLWSVALFTAASALCGLAQSLEQMVAFRILQGAAGAFLAPLGQAYVLDAWPPEKHGPAMAWWGVGIMVGPILGPVIGGWLTDSFDWRWVFLINLPFGIICFVLAAAALPQPVLPQRRFDMTGFALLAVGVGALQLCLDRGQQLDWLDSWEVRIEAGVAIAALWAFGVHSWLVPAGLLDQRMLRDSNTVTGFLFITLTGLLLVGTTALIPTMMQALFGYPVITTGIMQMPRGVGMMITMMLAGQLVGRGADPRLMIGAGFLMTAAALWGMSLFSPEQSAWPFGVTGFFQGAGLGLVFVPLNTIAFASLPMALRTDASAFFMLLRNLGGSVGISLGVGILARQMQVAHADLGGNLSPFEVPWADAGLLQALGGDAIIEMLDLTVNRQAAMVAYIDVFRLMAVVTLCFLPLLLLLKKPKSAEVVHLAD
ncbi:DHA2 family efflux MFS transporter permease subunit [Sandarakinorhabdus sp.]|uniref:DHA2 family efflux MFS transporter permease subunit n=1 Tax=Sandarakinorhabdus sp. TaxID=1916663 RepID=UPI00286E97AF|nr:DHA2 family efflux MFS transporter permease subunit [Sandarakinorhabdus sp.]